MRTNAGLLAGLTAMLVATLAVAAASETVARNWSIAPREAWVQSAPAMTAAPAPATGVLLHDRQIRITADGDDRYEHTVLRVSGARIIDDSTQVDVPVDPRFQELVVHTLQLTHGSDAARTFTAAQLRAQLQIQSREAEPRKRELNPQLRISLQVPDVHAGDILEFEYTVHSHAAGIPGALAGHYAAQWPSGADEPVRWERLHVSWPPGRALQFRIIGGTHGAAPQVVTHAGELDLQWQHLVPAATEPDTPRWFERSSAVQLSDFADWSQVAAFLAPQYGRPAQDQAQPAPQLDQPTALAAPGLILNALRLVQSKVAATNVVGDGPYVPAEPAVVLQRGYGDSRDLARLLVMLLRRVAIDAQVALANSRGVLLTDTLPSPFILDSAIVVARAGGVEYWLNPAAPGPAVALATTDPADLRRALLISPTGGRLVMLPPPAPDSRVRAVTQQFDLRGGSTQPGLLTLITQFRGSWAQAVRAQLLAQSPAQLQLMQAQSVAQDYPDASADGEVTLEDLPQRQTLQLSARFRLPRPFGDGRDPQFSFFAEALTEPVLPRDEATRRYPLDLPWPLQLEQHIVAALPPDFAAPEGTLVIEHPAFRYVREVRFDHGVLHIDHRYLALADHVDPADYPKFLQASAQVYQALGLRVQPRGFSWSRVPACLGQHSFALWGLAALLVVAGALWLRLRRA
jgi:Domain of Unknown Function with PDB structure (DUF3857)